MTIRCSVCRLPADKRSAIDAALRAGNVSLVEISFSSGISKSALGRHSRHVGPKLAVATQPAAVLTTPATVQIEHQPLIPAAAAGETTAPRPTELSKAQLLERIELLWTESLEGLEASKEPITITRPNGSSLELPGDLRARAGFVREARSVLELQGEATGHLVKGQTGPTFAIQIVMPQPLVNAVDANGNPVKSFEPIEIAMPRRG